MDTWEQLVEMAPAMRRIMNRVFDGDPVEIARLTRAQASAAAFVAEYGEELRIDGFTAEEFERAMQRVLKDHER